jgi:hypothetical protein
MCAHWTIIKEWKRAIELRRQHCLHTRLVDGFFLFFFFREYEKKRCSLWVTIERENDCWTCIRHWWPSLTHHICKDRVAEKQTYTIDADRRRLRLFFFFFFYPLLFQSATHNDITYFVFECALCPASFDATISDVCHYIERVLSIRVI